MLCLLFWLSSGLLKSLLFALFRFDTYTYKKESERLAQYLNAVPNGRILSVAVNDEGSRNLDDVARKAMTRLGSKHFLRLGFRYCLSPPPPQALGQWEVPTPQGRSTPVTEGAAGMFSICVGQMGLFLQGTWDFLQADPLLKCRSALFL